MIKGLPFIGKMNEFLAKALHATVQKVGNSRAAIDVIHRGYYIMNPVPTVPYVAEAGSTDEVIKLTNHGFKPGDLIRLDTTVNSINEFEIVIDSIIDVDHFKLAGYLSASISAGDTFFALRPVSERFAADGSTLASLSTPPVSYNRKVAGITTQTYVLEDQDNSANNRNLPVTIKSIDGAPINITAGDLNVALNHANDSTKIGDGTNLVGITLNNEMKTRDADLNTAMSTLNGKDFATSAKQDALKLVVDSIDTNIADIELGVASTNTKLDTLNSKDFATSAKQDTINASIGSTNSKLDTLNAFDFAQSVKQDTTNGYLAGISANGATAANQASTNTKLDTLIAKDYATAANQATEIARLEAIRDRLPNAFGATGGFKVEVLNTTGSEVPTQERVNTAGSLSKASVSTTATPVVAPANAVGFFIKNQGASAGILYWEIGGVADSLSNDLLPGQGSAFIPCSASVSVISESTSNYCIQWLVK